MPSINNCIDGRHFEPCDDEHGECRINPPSFAPNFLDKFKDDVMDACHSLPDFLLSILIPGGAENSPRPTRTPPPDMLTLSLPYPPGSNRLWRHERGGHRLSSEAIAWKRQAKWTALAAGCGLLVGDVEVALVLHPKLTKQGKASQTRLDVDAPIKLGLDALIGLAYQDDKQVVAVSCRVGAPCPDGGLTLTVGPA